MLSWQGSSNPGNLQEIAAAIDSTKQHINNEVAHEFADRESEGCLRWQLLLEGKRPLSKDFNQDL
jgi:hypothetical protein